MNIHDAGGRRPRSADLITMTSAFAIASAIVAFIFISACVIHGLLRA
jgi:hypothetical protein